MSIFREIIARFNVSVDDKDLKKLNKELSTTRDNLDKVATQGAIAFAGLGYGAYELVTLASDATENLNVLQQSFGDNADSVLMWADTMSKALGRSKYDLQDYAGRFGSFLQPVFEGSGKDIAGLSEQLTQLTVDLASFYNMSEEEAMVKLKSGLAGETEAVRSLGIDLSDEGLHAFNIAQSGGKDQRQVRSMNLQEKAAIRFAKIIKDTEKKQGDAARTADELANTLKRVQGAAKDLGVEMGKKLMPIVKDTFGVFEDLVLPGLQDLGMETNIVQHSFELAGGAAVTLAAGFALANKAALLNSILLVGLALVFDDLRSGAEGAKTALDSIAGKEEGDKSAWQNVNDFVAKWGVGGADVVGGTAADLALNLGGAFNAAMGRGDGVWHSENEDAALARFRANSSGQETMDASRPGSLAEAKRRAVEARDPLAYAEAFKGTGTVLPEDPTAAYMRDTKAAFERGDANHLAQDIANGVAPDSAAADFNAVTGKNELYRGAGSVMQPGAIQINMYGDNNEKKVAEHLGVMLRQTAASLGDEKSSTKKAGTQ